MIKKICILITDDGLLTRKYANKTFSISKIQLLKEIKKLGIVGASLDATIIQDYGNVENENFSFLNNLATHIYQHQDTYDSFVILSNPEKIPHIASCLSFMITGLKKPVILTGYSQSLLINTPLSQDNLKEILWILDRNKLNNEFAIYYNRTLFRGNRTIQINTTGFNLFDSPNFNHCGSFDGTTFSTPQIEIEKFSNGICKLQIFKPVNVYTTTISGFNPQNITANCQALILYGNFNNIPSQHLLSKFQEISSKGILIFNLSNCLHTKQFSYSPELIEKLTFSGVTIVGDMTYEACYAKLLYLYNVGYPLEAIKNLINISIAGEITSSKTMPIIDEYVTPLREVKSCLVIKHCESFGLGALNKILIANNFNIRFVSVLDDDLEKIKEADYDLVISLGSPTAAYDLELPWIIKEKALLKTRIELDRPTLGICFGAQLMAAAAGGKAYHGHYGSEIGYFSLEQTSAAKEHPIELLSRYLTNVFLWHSDTFTIPPQATLLAESEIYPQAFSVGNKCLALQFHAEIPSENAINHILQDYSSDLPKPMEKSRSELQLTTKQNLPHLTANAELFYKSWLQLALNCKLSSHDKHAIECQKQIAKYMAIEYALMIMNAKLNTPYIYHAHNNFFSQQTKKLHQSEYDEQEHITVKTKALIQSH
jgi:GMP synthase (glutamine-hydrolysing)